jgi:hypothetical protein
MIESHDRTQAIAYTLNNKKDETYDFEYGQPERVDPG